MASGPCTDVAFPKRPDDRRRAGNVDPPGAPGGDERCVPGPVDRWAIAAAESDSCPSASVTVTFHGERPGDTGLEPHEPPRPPVTFGSYSFGSPIACVLAAIAPSSA